MSEIPRHKNVAADAAIQSSDRVEGDVSRLRETLTDAQWRRVEKALLRLAPAARWACERMASATPPAQAQEFEQALQECSRG